MQEHLEQHLDKLAEKVMKSPGLEKPSLDFTANVMSGIKTSTSKTFVYKPLISKTGWLLIIMALMALSIYLTFNTSAENSIFNSVNLSGLTNNKLTELLSGITISKTFMYALGLFGLVWFIQVPILKHYMDKRLEY